MRILITEDEKNKLGIRVLKLQKFIITSASEILDGLKALWILGKNDNKKLQLGDSSRVVHKRSSSVILS